MKISKKLNDLSEVIVRYRNIITGVFIVFLFILGFFLIFILEAEYLKNEVEGKTESNINLGYSEFLKFSAPNCNDINCIKDNNYNISYIIIRSCEEDLK